MGIKDQEKELFNKWENQIGARKFVRDGVVHEKTFSNEKLKFVFVLKEANDLGMSLDKFLLKGAATPDNGNGGHTFNPVCRWLTGEDRRYTCEERAKILSRVAVMNLKKVDNGNAVTDMKVIEKTLSDPKYVEFLKQQYDLYTRFGPVIFVCCGTGMFDLFCERVLKLSTKEIDHNKKPVFMESKPKCWIMAFNHPNARKSGLASLFQRYVKEIVHDMLDDDLG